SANLLVAAAASVISRREPASAPRIATTEDPETAVRRAVGDAALPTTLVRLMLAVSFGTAVSSFVYEIGWIRMLSLVLGSATHSFELML
ncbi:MAG: hypothetical protein HOQ30_10195, partial [Gemmatimonadaceae bacterium]|nr:hypothetical protein [Gemmatimonadaceae bacterium]